MKENDVSKNLLNESVKWVSVGKTIEVIGEMFNQLNELNVLLQEMEAENLEVTKELSIMVATYKNIVEADLELFVKHIQTFSLDSSEEQKKGEQND